MTHNPFVDITKDTTTLMPATGDVFLFLVDDTHPIEAGRLADGRRICISGVYIVGTRKSNEDARHRFVLSPGGVHEPQSLGCREF